MNGLETTLRAGVYVLFGALGACGGSAESFTHEGVAGAGGGQAGASSTLGGAAGTAAVGHAGSGSVAGANSAGAPNGAPLECTAFRACGGDLIGTWQAERECSSSETLVEVAEALALCDSARVTALQLTIRGTVQFGSIDRVSDVTRVLKATETVPNDCFDLEDCSVLAAAFLDTGATVASCVAKPGACSCQLQYEFQSKGSASYFESGTSFSWYDEEAAQVESAEYCVAGNVLRIRESDVVALTRQN